MRHLYPGLHRPGPRSGVQFAGCAVRRLISLYQSQAHAGWSLIKARYDDGGYSGGSTDRPDLQRLLNDIRARKIDVIVDRVDRLTRSLADFAKLVELFDTHAVSFVSVTQQFNIPRPLWAG
jgi:DNA invertase Pin-like site-specific DNA recombinase